jgi:ABC-type Fe3+-citrate transport system substrate-binding protein
MRTKYGLTLIATTVLAGVALAGCATGGGTGSTTAAGQTAKVDASSNAGACGQETRSITHELGATEIKGEPQRVVALEFSFVDALASIGVKPVGVADDNDQKRILPQVLDQIAGYTSVGLRQSPNLQQISALKPDLIIADTERHKAIYDQLKGIAPTIAFDSLNASYQENLNSAVAISQALNRCAAMDERLRKHRDTMAAFKAKIPAGEKTRYMFGIASEKTFAVYTGDAYATSVLRELGLESVPPTEGQNTRVELSLETFVATDPPVLFVAKSADQTLFDQWQTSPLIRQVTAVKEHRVYPVTQAVWSRWRGIICSELIAQDVITKLYGG